MISTCIIGHGHLERVYANALAHRLRRAGLPVEQQHPIRVKSTK